MSSIDDLEEFEEIAPKTTERPVETLEPKPKIDAPKKRKRPVTDGFTTGKYIDVDTSHVTMGHGELLGKLQVQRILNELDIKHVDIKVVKLSLMNYMTRKLIEKDYLNPNFTFNLKFIELKEEYKRILTLNLTCEIYKN